MLILGFGHKARHGKDSAAAAIRDFYNSRNQLFAKHGHKAAKLNVGIFRFATSLYTEVNDAIEHDHGDVREVIKRYNTPPWVVPDSDPEFTDLAPYGKHPTLLQWWGTEYRRAQDPDYWVKKMFATVPKETDLVLITDVRFPNEAQGITQRGGYTIKVERLASSGRPFVAPDRPGDHPSETALDDYNWDFYLKIPHGHAALNAEMAVTLTEYLRGLRHEVV